MTKEVKVGGSVYNLEGMTDEEIARWIQERETLDLAIAGLREVFPTDEALADALATGTAHAHIARDLQRNVDAAKVATLRSQVPQCADLPDAVLHSAISGDDNAKAAVMNAVECAHNPPPAPRGLLSFDTENDLD